MVSQITDRVDVWQHVNRVAKYLLIAILLAIDITFIFTMFSGYIDRRQFDKIAAQDKDGENYYSLAYKVTQRSLNLADYYNTRCAQRDEIAFYRLGTYHIRDQLATLYRLELDATLNIRNLIRSYPEVNADFTLSNLQDLFGLSPRDLVFQSDVSEDDKFRVSNEILRKRKEISGSLTSAVEQSVPDTADFIKAELGKLQEPSGDAAWRIADKDLRKLDGFIFDLSSVATLERNYKALEGSMEMEFEDKPLNRAFIQMMVTQRAAVAGVTVEEAAESITRLLNPVTGINSEAALKELNCEASQHAIVAAVNAFFHNSVEPSVVAGLRSMLANSNVSTDAIPGVVETSWNAAIGNVANENVFGSGSSGTLVYIANALTAPFRWAAAFSSRPLTIQTLVVTVLFGVAGALSINALQLSRRGFWRTVADPGWGEITVSVVLGACAALMVFLLATLGLIVVSDGQSAAGDFSTVGASLVGVLGFISGLLNDEAFGRIKQVGQQFLSTPEEPVGPLLSIEDDLIDVLREAHCGTFASLVLIHKTAEEMASQIGKATFFLPSDAILDTLPPAMLDRLTSRADERPFRSLIDRAIYPASLSADDLRAQQAIVMRDNTRYAISVVDTGTLDVDGGTIKLADVRVWRDTSVFVFATPPKTMQAIWS